MTDRLNRKYILIGIPVILSLLIIGLFFFKIKTPSKVISGGSWTHYSQIMNPDGPTDYNQEADLIVVCTVEYNDQRPLSTTHILILSLTVNTPHAFLLAGDAGGMKAASLMMSLFILPRFVMQ